MAFKMNIGTTINIGILNNIEEQLYACWLYSVKSASKMLLVPSVAFLSPLQYMELYRSHSS